MANKLTKRDYFRMIREVVADREDLVEFIDKQVALLDKKSGNKGETKTQKENADIKTKLIEALVEIATPVTVTELADKNEFASQYSNQKLSALLNQLVKEDKIVKTTDKKKSLFAVKSEEDADIEE